MNNSVAGKVRCRMRGWVFECRGSVWEVGIFTGGDAREDDVILAWETKVWDLRYCMCSIRSIPEEMVCGRIWQICK